MELLEQPATLILVGIVFIFGGLGVFKLLRRSADSGESGAGQDDES